MANESTAATFKIMGYLEKRNKIKFVRTWKKYWFVLKDRLLLYYKSESDYENISPFRGSINIGLATDVKPAMAEPGVFEIITRTSSITLRAKDRSTLEKWLSSLLEAIGQSVPSPLKLSHFRYSLDNLQPGSTSRAFTRQNTLPVGAKTMEADLLGKIKRQGGQSYSGSADAINAVLSSHPIVRKIKSTQQSPVDDDDNSCQITQNDLYVRSDEIKTNQEIMIENDEYIPTKTNKNTEDHNKNCFLVENDEYIPTVQAIKETPVDDEEAEYYCTYDDLASTINKLSENAIYNEPNEPNQPNEIQDDDSSSKSSREEKKKTKFSKMSLKKMYSYLKKKVRKEKKVEDVDPVYDTVDYMKLEQNMKKNQDQELINTLLELQSKLEQKKTALHNILKHSSSNSMNNVSESPIIEEEEEKTDFVMEENSIYVPGLPPRKTKSCTPQKTQNTSEKASKHASVIPVISLDSDRTSKDSKDDDYMSVPEIIKKFEHSSISNEQINVSLRKKDSSSDYDGIYAEPDELISRHSDELTILLEELSKVTNAPLMKPGATSSLVQTKSDTLTDEEWLAITPIRRRRHSEPDYDVPRPHRSLQILTQSLEQTKVEDDSVISPKRFFGPVLATNDKPTELSLPWRSMTPDSLEPLQIYEAAMREYQKNKTLPSQSVEEESGCSGSELNSPLSPLSQASQASNYVALLTYDCNSNENDCIENNSFCTEAKIDLEKYDTYLDSLEPTHETLTTF